MGVALIIGGVDNNGSSLFLTDPSGTYVAYNAVAIGANSDIVTEFLKKEYTPDITIDEGIMLAIASIYLASEIKNGTKHIKISQIRNDTKQFEIITDEHVTKLAQSTAEKYPTEHK